MSRIDTHHDLLTYYGHQTPNSTPGQNEAMYGALPDEVADLCGVVQNALLHLFWIGPESCGFTLDQLKTMGRRPCQEFSVGPIADRLAALRKMDGKPLSASRPAEDRSIGCCRDFALLLTSMLRHKGIPARVRTGVARYLRPGEDYLEDHYITEFWNAGQEKWQLVDPQIDAFQRVAMKIDFDTTDIERSRFITGTALLPVLRAGEIKPEHVGFPPVNAGLTYGRNKLFHDFLNLVGQEIRVYAWWGIGDPKQPIRPEDDLLLDRMIELAEGIESNNPDALGAAIELAASDDRLVRPADYSPGEWSAPGFC